MGVPAGGEQDAEPAPAPSRRTDPSGALRAAALLAIASAVASLFAAAAETERFALLLEGRTKVLSGTTVRASDVFVAAAGATSVAVTIAALVVAVIALVRTHPVAALRLGSAPSRSTPAGPGAAAGTGVEPVRRRADRHRDRPDADRRTGARGPAGPGLPG